MRVGSGGGEQISVRRVFAWAGNQQFKVEQLGGINVRVAHIVAIADPRHAFASDVSGMIQKGLHIREHLAGMQQVGQGVDHRHATGSCKTLECLM